VCLDAPFVFEPGPDPDSIYAAPAKAKTGTKHPLQASSHSAPPRPTTTATRGGIGRTLSLNAASGRADAPEPMRHAARLTQRKDGHANGESQVLRRVLNHPHRHVCARARARRTARPGQALQSVHSFVCPFVSHSLCRRSNLKIDLFLLSGICSQVLSPQAFQTLPATTCSPAVNACFGGFLCSRIVSRYTAFYLCHFPLANQFPQQFVLGCLGPLAPGR